MKITKWNKNTDLSTEDIKSTRDRVFYATLEESREASGSSDWTESSKVSLCLLVIRKWEIIKRWIQVQRTSQEKYVGKCYCSTMMESRHKAKAVQWDKTKEGRRLQITMSVQWHCVNSIIFSCRLRSKIRRVCARKSLKLLF
jgi:hypothetical protein